MDIRKQTRSGRNPSDFGVGNIHVHVNIITGKVCEYDFKNYLAIHLLIHGEDSTRNGPKLENRVSCLRPFPAPSTLVTEFFFENYEYFHYF